MHATAVALELQALVDVLRWAQGEPLTLWVDSLVVEQTLRRSLDAWKARDFKDDQGQWMPNAYRWREVEELWSVSQVTLLGHSASTDLPVMAHLPLARSALSQARAACDAAEIEDAAPC
jgi:ribonuclease HI